MSLAFYWRGPQRGYAAPPAYAHAGLGAPEPQASAAPLGARIAYFYKPPNDSTAAEVAARTQLIILTHGDEAFLAQLRRLHYTGLLLQYIAANEAEGPGPYPDRTAACDSGYAPYQRTVADRPEVFCGEIHPHEDWFLHNRWGERLYTRTLSGNGVWRTTYLMNPASAGWRGLLLERLRVYRKLGWDGFFFDNVDLSRAGLLRQPDDRGGVAEYPDDASYRAAEAGYLAAVRQAFPGVPVWANLTHDPGDKGGWDPYLPWLDGVMVEDFALGWRRSPLPLQAREAQVANIRDVLGEGKGVVAVEQGGRGDHERLQFGLALYWALQPGAGAAFYFRYGDADDQDYRTLWWYPEYAFEPPSPAGPLEGGGASWRRAYPDGGLRLDLEAGTVSLPPAWSAAWR